MISEALVRSLNKLVHSLSVHLCAFGRRVWHKNNGFLYPSLPAEGQRSCSRKSARAYKLSLIVFLALSNASGPTGGKTDSPTSRLSLYLTTCWICLIQMFPFISVCLSARETTSGMEAHCLVTEAERFVRVQSNQCHLG